MKKKKLFTVRCTFNMRPIISETVIELQQQLMELVARLGNIQVLEDISKVVRESRVFLAR